jgi:hypothetical protein
LNAVKNDPGGVRSLFFVPQRNGKMPNSLFN